MASIFEEIFGKTLGDSHAETEYQRGLLIGYRKGFEAAKGRIAAMLEREGMAYSAAQVRKIELRKKQ